MARLINTSLYDDANLQEYYQLENVNGKNGHTLTNNGSVAFNAARYGSGADGGASNTTKYLRLTNKLGFGSGDYSVSFWVKINTDPSNSACDLIEIVDGTNGVSMEAGYQDSGGVKSLIAYWLRAGVASNDIVVNTTLGTSNFHHVVVVRDSGVLKLYLDGSLIGSVAISAGTGSGVTDSFTILAGRNNVNNISGIIDDLALFNRALSAAEVTTLFNDASAHTALGETPLMSDVNLVAYWRLDGNSFDSARNYHGTDTNSPVYSTGNGKFDKGVAGNGTNSKIELPTIASGGNSDPFTFSGWFNFTNTSTIGLLFDSGNPISGSDFLVRINQVTGGEIRAGYGSGNGAALTGYNDGNWHHLSFSQQTGTTGRWDLYIDGVSVAHGNRASESLSNALNSAMLYRTDSTWPYIGKLDDVAWFSRDLSSAEVLSIYNAGISSASASVSPSLSPSASRSPSASVSPSLSPSASNSPSASRSPSASLSPSISPSSSISRSLSPSASVSPSVSPSASASPSISASLSPSASMSSSPSSSPSIGFTGYSRGSAAALPASIDDLDTLYTELDVYNTTKRDETTVRQSAQGEYILHQFKTFIGDHDFFTAEWSGKSDLAPNQSPVHLQLFNYQQNAWETVAVNQEAYAGVDFELEAKVANPDRYKDDQHIMVARVYQLAI